MCPGAAVTECSRPADAPPQGPELYEKIFKHYTYKQWDKYPAQLDASVLLRIPVRTNTLRSCAPLQTQDSSSMDDVQAALAKVEAEIEALAVKLDKVEVDVEAARARQDEAEVAELRKKEDKLRTEKEQLRTKEEDLRKEKAILLLERLGALRWLQITHLDN